MKCICKNSCKGILKNRFQSIVFVLNQEYSLTILNVKIYLWNILFI